jgi:hypothetical protein
MNERTILKTKKSFDLLATERGSHEQSSDKSKNCIYDTEAGGEGLGLNASATFVNTILLM